MNIIATIIGLAALANYTPTTIEHTPYETPDKTSIVELHEETREILRNRVVRDLNLDEPVSEIPTSDHKGSPKFGESYGKFTVIVPRTVNRTPATIQAETTETVTTPAPVQNAGNGTQAGTTQNTTPTAPTTRQAVTTRTATPVTAPTVTENGSGGQAIVNAALAQLGQYQDCTSLVNRALQGAGYAGGVGTLFSGLAPRGYQVSSPQPGDIIYYTNQRHVALYIGGGMAVHGGWTGHTTVVASAGATGPAIYYRVW